MRRLTSLITRLGRFLGYTTRDYVITVRGGSEGAGLRTLRELVRGGPLYWLGLGVLLVGILSTAYLVLQGQRLPLLSADIGSGDRVTVPAPALYLAMAIMAFAWAYLLAGAANIGLAIYVITAAYVCWHGLLGAVPLAGTLWWAVIPLWVLALGNRTAVSVPSRWRIPLLGILSLIVAFFSYWTSATSLLPRTSGTLLLGLSYWALIANPLALRGRPLKPSLAFGISLLLFTGYNAATLMVSDPVEALRNTFIDLHSLLGALGLFWYWMGLDLFNGAQGMAEWLVRTIRGLLPARALRATILALWGMWMPLAYLVPSIAGLGGESSVSAPLVRSWHLSAAILWAMRVHTFLMLAFLSASLVLWRVKKLSENRLLDLFGLSVFAFLALLGYHGLNFGLQTRDLQAVLGFWPLALVIAGMFWQMLMSSAELITGGRGRSLFFLGFLLAVAGISELELAAGYRLFQMELTMNAILGVLFLGLPYVLYQFVYQRWHLSPIPSMHLLGLVAIGMVSAVLCRLLGSMLWAPWVWLVALRATTWRWGYWNRWPDGLTYALSMGLGFVAYYTDPIALPIPAYMPVLARLVELSGQWYRLTIYPWQKDWWYVLLAICGAAALQGYWLSRARFSSGRTRILPALLAPMTSIAYLAACQVILGI